jgi:hypothetical protein
MAAIIHDNTIPGVTIGEMFRDLAKKDGAEILTFEGVNWGERDWSPVLTSLKQKNPDALYLGMLFPDAALAMKQAKGLGLTLDVLGPDGMYSDDLIKLGGPAVEGVCATALGADVKALRASAGLGEKDLRDPDARIPSSRFGQLPGDLVDYTPIEPLVVVEVVSTPTANPAASEQRNPAAPSGGTRASDGSAGDTVERHTESQGSIGCHPPRY